MKNLIVLVVIIGIIFGCTKPTQQCWVCSTAYKNLVFNKQYCDYSIADINKLEGITLISDTVVKKRIDTLYWVINTYDSMPSILNPAVDTFFLVNWKAYNRLEWDVHPEIHQYWKYGKRQGFGVLETHYDTLISKYTKTVTCKEWEIN